MDGFILLKISLTILIFIILIAFILFKKEEYIKEIDDNYHNGDNANLDDRNTERRNSSSYGRRVADWVRAYTRKDITEDELIEWLENKIKKSSS